MNNRIHSTNLNANQGQNGDLIPRPMLFVSLKFDAVVKECKGLKKLDETGIKLLDSVNALSSLRIQGSQPNYHR